MATIDGDVYLRVGETDPVRLQLFYEDGITPIPLANITALQIRFRDSTLHSTVKNFTGPKIDVEDEAEGIIIISQVAGDFLDAKVWEYYVQFTDSASKVVMVPKKGTQRWIIEEAF